jgi:hypothetical protein
VKHLAMLGYSAPTVFGRVVFFVQVSVRMTLAVTRINKEMLVQAQSIPQYSKPVKRYLFCYLVMG